MIIPHPSHLVRIPGHFTFTTDTTVRVTEGAEDAARLLRTLLGPATGLPLRSSPTATSSSPWTRSSAGWARRATG